MGTHWSYDPGAQEFTRELSQLINIPAILSRYSRLLCDPNRPIGSDTMFRPSAEGINIQFNQQITPAEQQSRLHRFYGPYHSTLATFPSPSLALSIHSFTPCYEGSIRTVEIGVLFCDDGDLPLAQSLCDAFESAGIHTAINEPWSGKEGFMFAANQCQGPNTQVKEIHIHSYITYPYSIITCIVMMCSLNCPYCMCCLNVMCDL